VDWTPLIYSAVAAGVLLVVGGIAWAFLGMRRRAALQAAAAGAAASPGGGGGQGGAKPPAVEEPRKPEVSLTAGLHRQGSVGITGGVMERADSLALSGPGSGAQSSPEGSSP
jgi:hypothetical protein